MAKKRKIIDLTDDQFLVMELINSSDHTGDGNGIGGWLEDGYRGKTEKELIKIAKQLEKLGVVIVDTQDINFGKETWVAPKTGYQIDDDTAYGGYRLVNLTYKGKPIEDYYDHNKIIDKDAGGKITTAYKVGDKVRLIGDASLMNSIQGFDAVTEEDRKNGSITWGEALAGRVGEVLSVNSQIGSYEIKMLGNDGAYSEGDTFEIFDKAIEGLATEEAPKTEEPKTEQVIDSVFLKTLLSTIATQMADGKGTGVDSPQVRAIIKEYLGKDKVHLSELDASVLAEIRKNQTTYLHIPNYSKPIEIRKSDAEIPNFYEIIDDIMAGNNVYLIGEAGGGKTYTAETISNIIGRKYVTLNCSQYTSPLEILGGQSVEGFKQGKLIDCWRNGKILIMDEMPKLDPNTAGLFNDALAKSSKTRSGKDAKINSANAEEPPIERHNDFAIIATGNIYPNEAPAPQYRGNNQQDLSLLDRFSGSVYYTEFSEITDQKTTRFKFLYKLLVGNYYEYIQALKEGNTPPTPRGLRTIIESLNLKNLALVSYRTNTAFRVGFEYELVRAIARKEGNDVGAIGKTLAKTFDSYMTAFRSNRDTYNNVIRQTGFTEQYIQNEANNAIEEILSGEDGFFNSLNAKVQETANTIYKRYNDFYVTEPVKVD